MSTKRKTPTDYHALAKQRGFRWLGPEVPSTQTKTTWVCSQGHQWEARSNSMQRGDGCPFCAGVVCKTSSDYHALARTRGFQWLGPEVPNNRTQTTWKCGQGHQWEAPYSRIQQGGGCPTCARAKFKTPDDYHELARSRGFAWLGPEVKNTGMRTRWRCQKGHQWEAPYTEIRRGRGCAICAGVAAKTPDDYYALAKKRGIRWLGPEVPNNATKTYWECQQGHRWEACYSSILRGTGCPVCAGMAPKIPADYFALAQARGFQWLGPEVKTTHTKTTWQCSQGHQWKAHYSAILEGTGCPICARAKFKTPADYHALAESRGFQWLGPEVRTTGMRTTWRCEHGHEWEAPYNRIQRGAGCLICSGKATKTPEDYHAIAQSRGFKWLGPEVPTVETETLWECSLGHQWTSNFHKIQSGKGCPVCVDRINGAHVSQPQRHLAEMLGGVLNHPVGDYRIDVALQINNVEIAVEYDSWCWHAHKKEFDLQRDNELIAAGWRVLHVKSNFSLPTQEQLEWALSQLLEGKTRVEIVLEDWGKGSTRFDVG